MNMDFLPSYAGILVVLSYFGLTLAFIIFWMVVAWRFMRAHERLATAHELLADSANECRHAVRARFRGSKEGAKQ